MFTVYSVRKIWFFITLLVVFSLTGVIVAAPVAQAAPVQVADPETVYIVQRGDTLSAIARRYGVTVQALMAYNSLQSTTIYVGQRLLIPVASPSTPLTYVVQKGDTLYSIGRRYGVTVAQIKTANNLKSDTIYVGQRLLIPSGGNPPTPVPSNRQRIQFAPGTTSATVSGTVQAPNRREYVFGAQVGQAIRIELISTDASANFALSGLGDGQPLKRLENSNTVWTGTLPSTQDYLLQVASPSNSAVGYELYVEIQPVAVGTPERIQFAAGATSATVTGYTTAIEPKRYVLRALAGQTMDVNLATESVHTYITVLNPRAENMAGADGPIHNWSGRLPATGDYIIEVLNSGTGLANFALTVTVR